MTISLVRLSDGTEIVGNVKWDDSTHLVITKPLNIHYKYFFGGVPSVSFSRYMMFASSENITIKQSHVMVVTEARKAFADFYEDSVEEYYGKLQESVDGELISALSTAEKEQALKRLLEMIPTDKATAN
jgi:hypothetical protein